MSTGGSTEGALSRVAAAAVSAYRRVRIDSNGQVAHAGLEPADGVSLDAAAAGALVPVKLFSQGGTFELEANEASSKGATLYPAAAGRIGDTAGEGGQYFRALDAAAAQGDIIQTVLVEAQTTELVYANVADSATVTNDTAETDFDKTVSLSGAALAAGDVLEIEALVNVPSTNSTDTLTLKLYVGTEVIATISGGDVADADMGYIRALVVVRAAGASGTLAAFGNYMLDAAGTLKTTFRLAEASEDLSGAVVVKLSATWSVAHADNQCDLEHLVVKLHRRAA